MKPSSEILECGGSFRFEVYHGGKRFVSGTYSTKVGAEFAMNRHIAQLTDVRRNSRLEQILDEFGMVCCRMAYKLTYCHGTPLQEVAEVLGLTEDQAEQASEAGRHTLRDFSQHGKLSKERARELIDLYFERGYDDEL